jgi:uncharacterized coiled-coil DUF342 family protein
MDEEIQEKLAETRKLLDEVAEERNQMHLIIHEFVRRTRDLMEQIEKLESELGKNQLH